MTSSNVKLITVTAATVLFAATMVFIYLLMTDESILADRSKTFVYAAAYIAVFVILNVLLLVTVFRSSRKLKMLASKKRCASCDALMDIDASFCPKCSAIQPDAVTEDVYMEPKGTDDKIKPKG
ncbi:MAG: zinc ribbon domain-containing protein [Methanomassiliicoccaceae archaeon]|nr:zinc ribbon domain-containing protein [Methanomassiliicoccaceae archaeon]